MTFGRIRFRPQRHPKGQTPAVGHNGFWLGPVCNHAVQPAFPAKYPKEWATSRPNLPPATRTGSDFGLPFPTDCPCPNRQKTPPWFCSPPAFPREDRLPPHQTIHSPLGGFCACHPTVSFAARDCPRTKPSLWFPEYSLLRFGLLDEGGAPDENAPFR